MIDLSIIIVSYNTKTDLKNCLRSIYRFTKNIDFEVIVVDNNSQDGSPEMVSTQFPKAKVIHSKKNLGFGNANNLGSKAANGEYLLFLNPDTILKSDAIIKSLEYARDIKNLGALSIQLLFQDGSIQPSGGYFPTLTRMLAWHTAVDEIPIIKQMIRPFHPSASFYQSSFEPDWITGAYMLIPKKVFREAGGFDSKIFMYGEDMELCYRLKQKGLKIIYLSDPTITHLQSKSSSSIFALTSEVKGILYFFKKHKPAWQLPAVTFAFKLGSLLRLLLFGIILGDDSKKKAYYQILTS